MASVIRVVTGALVQEEYVAAELVLATLLETARLSEAGPTTVAVAARKRAAPAGTPGGGRIPGDTPWRQGAP